MKKNTLSGIWNLCPGRWKTLLLSLAWIGAYFALRSDRGCMNTLCRVLVRPFHRFAGRLSDKLAFSLAEWCIAAALLAAALFLLQLLLWLVRTALAKRGRKPGGRRLLLWGVTLATVLSLIFGFFCLWWGVFYYSDSFTRQSGVTRRDISTEELTQVTGYFVDLANEYAAKFPRGETGETEFDLDEIFAASPELYASAEKTFPCLAGPPLHAKPVHFSRIMSVVNYTGFFFPYTAEANINVDSPSCLIPSTIAHELAHQRGVAGEDEANFVAVLASLESGRPEYVYSAALLAYIHLGNALYGADYAAWQQVASRLVDAVWRDLSGNNAYWKQFEGKPAEVSEKVYESYLQIYGDDRGMQSYGACVDLLVCYYLDK